MQTCLASPHPRLDRDPQPPPALGPHSAAVSGAESPVAEQPAEKLSILTRELGLG